MGWSGAGCCHAGAAPVAVPRGSADVPLLAGRTGAGPDLQARAVRRAAAGRVEALVGPDVRDVLGRLDPPLLRVGSVAVVELDLRAVGRASRGDVQALAQ